MSTGLPVMECFYSIQGEGAHSGVPAFFIRLGGCDVGCVWCDVKASWNADAHPKMTVDDLMRKLKATPARIVVITGGEPAMYDLTELTTAIQQGGIKTHLETSGVYPLHGSFDWITFSPKKFKSPTAEIYQQAHELKVIAYNRSDLGWAQEHQEKINPDCKLFLQPEWSKRQQMQVLILEFILAHPEWSISVQTHKYLGVD